MPPSSPESSPYVSTLLFLSLLINPYKSPGKRHCFLGHDCPHFSLLKGNPHRRGSCSNLTITETTPQTSQSHSHRSASEFPNSGISGSDRLHYRLLPRRWVLQLRFTLLSGSPILTLGSGLFLNTARASLNSSALVSLHHIAKKSLSNHLLS